MPNNYTQYLQDFCELKKKTTWLTQIVSDNLQKTVKNINCQNDH